jgi:hypothetical protein
LCGHACALGGFAFANVVERFGHQVVEAGAHHVDEAPPADRLGLNLVELHRFPETPVDLADDELQQARVGVDLRAGQQQPLPVAAY